MLFLSSVLGGVLVLNATSVYDLTVVLNSQLHLLYYLRKKRVFITILR